MTLSLPSALAHVKQGIFSFFSDQELELKHFELGSFDKTVRIHSYSKLDSKNNFGVFLELRKFRINSI